MSLGKTIIELWCLAANLPPDHRGDLDFVPSAVEDAIRSALLEDDAVLADKAIRRIVWVGTSPRDCYLLASLREFDNLFNTIHPRHQSLPPKYRSGITPPNWLSDFKQQRRDTGCYEESDDYRLIAKGPLTRVPRRDNASYADSIFDRFVSISVVHTRGQQEQRRIPIQMVAISSAVGSGVPSFTSRLGSEVVAFIPTAELKDELIGEVETRNGQDYVEISLGATFDPAARLMTALQCCGTADIAIGSELTLTSPHLKEISDSLALIKSSVPGLIIAGTAPTESVSERNQAWNEAVTFNAHGKVLWSQRKLVPYAMDRESAISSRFIEKGTSNVIGVSGPIKVVENNAAGDTLLIADIESAGRCIILICQDFNANPLVTSVLAEYQPDWIFVPILARGCGHWVRNRIFELSSYSQGRFAICSSSSISHACGDDIRATDFGLAAGPFDPSDSNCARAAALLKNEGAYSQPMWAKIRWGHGDRWRQFNLLVTPRR
jgi:hypothetical protein